VIFCAFVLFFMPAPKLAPSSCTHKTTMDFEGSWQELWESSRFVKGRHYGSNQPIVHLSLQVYGPPPLVCCWDCDVVLHNALCECGLDEPTLDHIFFCCSRFYYSYVFPKNIPRPAKLQSVLISMDSPFSDILIQYVQEPNIKL
jgi:hypothetical protein